MPHRVRGTTYTEHVFCYTTQAFTDAYTSTHWHMDKFDTSIITRTTSINFFPIYTNINLFSFFTEELTCNET